MIVFDEGGGCYRGRMMGLPFARARRGDELMLGLAFMTAFEIVGCLSCGSFERHCCDYAGHRVLMMIEEGD